MQLGFINTTFNTKKNCYLLPILFCLFFKSINCYSQISLDPNYKINCIALEVDSFKTYHLNKVFKTKLDSVNVNLCFPKGIEDGSWVAFYKDTSVVALLITFKNIRQDGYEIRYWKNGNIQLLRYFNNAFLEGPSYSFYPNGMTHVFSRFKHDELIEKKVFDESGKLIKEKRTK
jgi:hypothetical protein